MTVQRQYTLPNCNLTLEGLTTGDESDPMAPLTVLLNSEFAFPGLSETLSGGRELLEALAKVVSNHVQSLLSGVPYPMSEEVSAAQPVTLTATEHHRHKLTATVTNPNGEAVVKTLNLNSVQLFDLMEALDQVGADVLTLPDLTLPLQPIDRRHARPMEPASKKVVPLVTGLSALAASAALLFMVPVPQFEPQRTNEEQQTSAVEENGEASTAIAESPAEPTTEETLPNDSEVAETPDDGESGADPVAAATALSRLGNAPAITDADTLDELATDLETSLAEELPESVPFEEDLVYRVAVSETGDLLGYKYENDAAIAFVDSTPLPALTFIPVEPEAAVEEPVAQFRVTFNPDGEVNAEALTPESDEASAEE